MAITVTEPEISLKQHVVYICSRFLAYALPVLFFLVTSSFYLKTYDSAQVKITFTQIGTICLIFVWFVKILVEGRWPFKKEDWVYVTPFLAFMLSALVAYALTPFKGWSLEETLRRVFYMFLAIITIAEMRSSERMKRLWRWLMAAAWVAIGYGLIQYLDSRWFIIPASGIDPFIWRQAFGHRVFSTFGNPNFYGNFLVIMTPLILASVLRHKGSLKRPFVMLIITVALFILIDKVNLGKFGGFDPSFRVIYYFVGLVLLILFLGSSFWQVGASVALPGFLILFALLILNLYSTETKGAWVGFTSATAATLLLILEYFLHLEERDVNSKKYFGFILFLTGAFAALFAFMVWAFVIPLIKGTVTQVGFSILWIPTFIAGLISMGTLGWVMRKPWNLKKVVYAALILFVLMMGAGILQYAKTRLLSVSFRLFTWVSTWEMVQTNPILGNGVGTFKAIYPAYRRPQIITLEGKSNTETDHSEDEYIEVWQDEGIIGFGIFLWMILTALYAGFKQLAWYSRLRVPDENKKRALLEIESDPRSYEVLGILGAYIGALIHWTMDVSVRFVSSGVFSGLLPGLLVAYARNHNKPMLYEARLSYDRWIRFSVALFWTGVMLYLGMELVPNAFIQSGDTSSVQIVFFIVLCGLALFALIEVLEIGNNPEKNIPFSLQYGDINPSFFPLRMAGVFVVAFFAVQGAMVFGNQFQADVHHNLAIFFSKQAVWSKAPRYEAKLSGLPPDIRKKYQDYGGALEHYQEVEKNNSGFPMARYFTANVHNDRGSEYFGQALQVRQSGNQAEADRLKDRAIEEWNFAEQAYERTKELAPNYVQTHHQVGLLYVKRAELYREWGDNLKMKENYQIALKNFYRYKMLDPVFPPNYDRIAQILLMEGKFDEPIALYKEAIYYNDEVARAINVTGYPERVAELTASLAKVYFGQANSLSSNPFNPRLKQIDEALAVLKKGAENNPKNLEVWKLMGLLYERGGEPQKAQEAYRKAVELNPTDPDLKRAG